MKMTFVKVLFENHVKAELWSRSNAANTIFYMINYHNFAVAEKDMRKENVPGKFRVTKGQEVWVSVCGAQGPR